MENKTLTLKETLDVLQFEDRTRISLYSTTEAKMTKEGYEGFGVEIPKEEDMGMKSIHFMLVGNIGADEYYKLEEYFPAIVKRCDISIDADQISSEEFEIDDYEYREDLRDNGYAVYQDEYGDYFAIRHYTRVEICLAKESVDALNID